MRCFQAMEEDAKTERLALCWVALSPHFQCCAVSEGVSLALGSSFLVGCDPSEFRVLVPVLAQPLPARGAGLEERGAGTPPGSFLTTKLRFPSKPQPMESSVSRWVGCCLQTLCGVVLVLLLC